MSPAKLYRLIPPDSPAVMPQSTVRPFTKRLDHQDVLNTILLVSASYRVVTAFPPKIVITGRSVWSSEGETLRISSPNSAKSASIPGA